MSTNKDLNEAIKAYNEAEKLVCRAERNLEDKHEAERQDFEACFERETENDRANIDTLRKFRSDAEEKLHDARVARGREQAAKSATPPGTMLFEWTSGRGGWSYERHEPRLSGRKGLVEVWDRESDHRANIRWGLPTAGDLVVRILKKDGGRSLDFMRLDGWRSEWLPEGKKPEGAK